MNAREEWLQARKIGLGGSDIGAILGLSPYRTPVDIWLDKTGQSPQQEESLQMRFGSYAEEFVAQEYSRTTGLAVQRYTNMLRHPTAPLIGNIDRLVIPAGQKKASHQKEIRTDRLLECKTASAFAAHKAEEWGDSGTDHVPMAYLVQVATYRILSGCRFADLAVLFGNQEVRIYSLPSDADLESMIVAKATEWWNRHVIGGVAPDPVCESDVRALYPSSTPAKSIEADDRILVSLSDLSIAKAEVAKWERLVEQHTVEVKAAMGDAEMLTVQGRPVATWKSAKPSMRTDWKAVANAVAAPKNVIDLFTTESAGSRRFLLKDEK